ncbi:hypothetical protein Pse7367_0683 [Thalassoporum mexicanum PCC 7367]|uniref:DUF2281 domain-containing protein n=1 Tax=Thalassoporum mexicanum TaxID=3457544 RepID=UPI00029FA441|nr:DUF2281 domain-containing protein [Pseudanabaena sp. PCC 7367]AFY68986.1 hypothetical protein Pse7367_0683 [Pseudanabaena sp. PCC 7367]
MTKQAKDFQSLAIAPNPPGQWAVYGKPLGESVKVFSALNAALDFVVKISSEQNIDPVISESNGMTGAVNASKAERPESGFGCAKGLIFMSPDFDEPLEEFSDYM